MKGRKRRLARTGRPKLENPRNKGVFIRLTEKEYTIITEYASDHNLTITQTLVQGFQKLWEQEKEKDNE